MIEKSYNYGNITGYNNTAGVAGYTTGVVTESGNYGEISGSANVAGIVGLYKGAESNEIQKSVNKGRITGTKTGIIIQVILHLATRLSEQVRLQDILAAA